MNFIEFPFKLILSAPLLWSNSFQRLVAPLFGERRKTSGKFNFAQGRIDSERQLDSRGMKCQLSDTNGKCSHVIVLGLCYVELEGHALYNFERFLTFIIIFLQSTRFVLESLLFVNSCIFPFIIFLFSVKLLICRGQ